MAKIYRFELTYADLDNNSLGMSTMHYQTDTSVIGSEPDVDDVLGEILEHFSSSGHNLSKWTSCMYDSTKLTRAVAREEVEPGSGDIPAIAEETLTLTGTLGTPGSNQAPPGLALWIALKTGNASRSARGGTHVPGSFSALVLDAVGKFTTSGTFFTNCNTLGTAMVDALEDVFGAGGDLLPVIYSRTRRARGLSPFTFQLTNAVPSPVPRYVRRREPGRGT